MVYKILIRSFSSIKYTILLFVLLLFVKKLDFEGCIVNLGYRMVVGEK